MKRNTLLAIAVGSILGAALPQAYADNDVPKAATSEDNQQHNTDRSADQRDRVEDRRDIKRDQADIRADQKDLQRDRADLRADRQDLRRDNGGAEDQRDIRRDRADIRADQKGLERDRADLRADRQDLRADRQDLRAGNNVGNRAAAGQRTVGQTSQGQPRAQTIVDERNEVRDSHAAASARRADANGNASRRPDMTAAGLAKNAGANNRKPPSTTQHMRAWYHYWW